MCQMETLHCGCGLVLRPKASLSLVCHLMHFDSTGTLVYFDVGRKVVLGVSRAIRRHVSAKRDLSPYV